MKNNFNYNEMFLKIVGKSRYTEVLKKISEKINDKFKNNISLETFAKIIEINIKTILIMGISRTIKKKDNEIKEIMYYEKSKKYIVEKDYNTFLQEYEEYIDIVKNFIERE